MKALLCLLLLFSAILLAGCQHTPIDQVRLVEAGKASFTLDPETEDISGLTSLFTYGGQEYLVYYNLLRYRLQFYSLHSGKLVHVIQYYKSGTNAIPHFESAVIRSRDSIFILSTHIKKLYLTDWQGQVKHVYDLNTDSATARRWASFEPCREFVMDGSIAVFGTVPIANFNQPAHFYTLSNGAAYNVATGQLTPGLTVYPACYQSGASWGFYYSFYFQTLTPTGQLVLSYPIADSLYILDLQTKKRKAYLASSRYLTATPPYSVGSDAEDYFQRTDAYDAIIYDKYRRVYYRFATQGVAEIPARGSAYYIGAFKKLSVIILNEHFVPVGETLLPAQRHYLLDYFVGKQGLYLSDSHPFNPQRQEAQLTFTCYQLRQTR